jgi:hypothetical protein
MDLRLYITLRILSGATYLDMIWYGVNVDHVQEMVLSIVAKLDLILDNIQLPQTAADWEVLARNWANIQLKGEGGI